MINEALNTVSAEWLDSLDVLADHLLETGKITTALEGDDYQRLRRYRFLDFAPYAYPQNTAYLLGADELVRHLPRARAYEWAHKQVYANLEFVVYDMPGVDGEGAKYGSGDVLRQMDVPRWWLYGRTNIKPIVMEAQMVWSRDNGWDYEQTMSRIGRGQCEWRLDGALIDATYTRTYVEARASSWGCIINQGGIRGIRVQN